MHINSLNNKYKQIGWYSWIYIYDVVTISYDCNASVRPNDSNEHRTRPLFSSTASDDERRWRRV